MENLQEIIREQMKRRGRVHLRGLIHRMRKEAPPSAVESMQEISLILRRRLRVFAPKTKPRTGKAPSGGQVFPYFPGCLVGESTREYDTSIRRLLAELNVHLAEIDGWTCCGGGVVREGGTPAGKSFAGGAAEHASAASVVSGCPLCVERLREAGGADSALHVLDLLSRGELREALAVKIRATGEERPVGSLKVVCYEGCGVSRGASGKDAPAPPLPEGEGMRTAKAGRPPMEALMELAGARVCEWNGPRRRLGPFGVVTESESALRTLDKLFRDFEKSGADAIVTACPHCHFQLDTFQYALGRKRRRALEVPILHFTEVLGLAMNFDEMEDWLDRHVTGVLPLVDRLASEEEKRQSTAPNGRKQGEKG